MLVVTGNGEKPDRQNKNQNADHEKQEAVHKIRPMNDDAGYFCADGRNEPLRAKLPERPSESLKLPFLFLLFFGYKRYAYTQKCYAEESYPYSQEEREIFKEIARKGNCDDGFAEIGNHFADKFPALIADNNHRFNDNMVGNICQTQFSRLSRQFSRFLALMRLTFS